MIDRNDMLLLTRRMNPERSSITRIAGAYMDEDGYIDGTFNTNFLNLSKDEKMKNLEIAKCIPFADTNEQLRELSFDERSTKKQDSMWHLLWAMKDCGLKNDAIMQTFYEIVGECFHPGYPYAIYVFHDRYDIPAKGSDKVRLGESEEMFEYLICAICPVSGDYEPGEPRYGFLFPAFSKKGAKIFRVDVFAREDDDCRDELTDDILGCIVEY